MDATANSEINEKARDEFAPSRSRRHRTRERRPRRDWIGACAAVLALLLLLVWAQAYVPAEPWLPWLAIPLALLSAWRPAWALTTLLALWPLADRTIASGSLFATESDLALLAVVIGGGIGGLRAQVAEPRGLRISALAIIVYGLLLIAVVIGIARAYAIGPLFVDGLPLAGYSSPHNALRIAKGMLWPILLAPLVHRAVRESVDSAKAFDWLFSGMAGGLLAVCAAAILERLRFTGLTDFSSDYRITAPFWEMHVGGAALDGFLALSLPFVLSWAMFERRPLRMAVGLAIAALAMYVSFVTFSRGVYAALLAIVVVFVVARLIGRARLLVLAALLAAASLVGFSQVFSLAGYRGLAAVLALAIAVILSPLCGPRPGAGQLVAAWVLGLCFAGLSWVGTFLFSKASYLAFAGLLSLAGLCIVFSLRRTSAWLAVLMQACLIALAFTGMLIGGHWGGSAAGWAVGVLSFLVLIPAWLRGTRLVPSWQPFSSSARGCVAVMLIAAGASVALGNTYMSGRFSQSGSDLEGRKTHWSSIAALLRTPIDMAIGIGLGRLPEAYFWSAPGNQFPGGYALRPDANGSALHMIAPRHPLGWGDMLRVGQLIPRDARAPFVVRLQYRATVATELHAEVCRRQLIYANQCATRYQGLPPSNDWKNIELPLSATSLSGAGRLAPPLFFALALGRPGSVAELRDIHLTDAQGRSLLENGELLPDRRGGLAHWFFTSDRLHLAWHAKNMWLALACDLGLFGVVVFTLLMLGAIVRLIAGRARGHPLATVLVASLVGFGIVGIFDSLIDVPRVATLALVLIWLALCLRSVEQSGAEQMPIKNNPPEPSRS